MASKPIYQIYKVNDIETKPVTTFINVGRQIEAQKK